jgi:Tfp pilus assembly PilM family ATPase/Tfp pilus assembly protein PilN
MLKRCIGIDLGRTHVCAAQVGRTAAGFRLERAFAAQTRRSSDSLAAILHSLTQEQGFDRHAPVAVALPHQAFFFADIETDTAGWEKIRAADAGALKDYFPLPAEEIVAQVCSVLPMEGDKSSVLVAASSRAALREELQALAEAHLKPVCLDTPVTAVQATILTNHPQAAHGLAAVLYVDAAALSLAVTHEGRLLLVRTIPLFGALDQPGEGFAPPMAEILAPEIEITWTRLFGSSPDPGLRLFLIAPGPLTQSLTPALQDKAGVQVVAVDPYARLARAEGVAADLPLSVAEGLALRVLEPGPAGGLDFLAAYRARTRPKLRLRKELTVCGLLAAAAAVVWVAGLFLQLSSLEAVHRQLKKQIETAFHEALPEEQNLIDPVAQLQQKLDALRKERGLLTSLNPGRSAPLEILSALSHCTPATAHLKLHDVVITADSVRIAGSCDSYAILMDWQHQLEAIPALHLVDVRPTKDAQSGQVKFTISLAAREGKA